MYFNHNYLRGLFLFSFSVILKTIKNFKKETGLMFDMLCEPNLKAETGD